jgi:hypothetical protein
MGHGLQPPTPVDLGALSERRNLRRPGRERRDRHPRHTEVPLQLRNHLLPTWSCHRCRDHGLCWVSVQVDDLGVQWRCRS